MTAANITALVAHIVSECTTVDREACFDSMLDDCYSFESIGGPFAHMSPSSVLKEVDPVAYRCGVNDMKDDQWVEVDGEYYDADEVEKAKESFLSELEDEETELEDEIEEEESAEEPDVDAIARDQAKLADVQARIAEVNAYSF